MTETSLENPEITFFDLFCETQGWCSCRDVFPIRSYHGIAAPDGRDAPHTSTSFRTRGGDYHQPGAKRCCCCFGNAGRKIRMGLRTVYHLDTLIYIYISFIMNPDCKKHGVILHVHSCMISKNHQINYDVGF